jgi:dTDP-4-amino-4,6-dideoxygalactose transaminase
MMKLTEAAPTAGLALSWRDFIPSLFSKNSRVSLEQKLALFIGAEEVQVECSGTAALVVALEALKIMSDRKQVVINAYTCPWVALAVIKANLIPIIADSQPEHFDYCEKSLKSVVNNQTLAVVQTHLAGRVANVEKTITIAKSAGAYVIEDAAQSLGAKFENKSVGTFGDIGFYSLGVGKGLTIFSGGVVVSENEQVREALRLVSNHLPRHYLLELRRAIELVAYYLLYRPVGMGLAFGRHLRNKLKRGNLIQAVGDDCSFDFPLHKVGAWRKMVGASAADRLPDFIAKTKKIADKRLAQLTMIPSISVVLDAEGGEGVWPFFIVRMPSEGMRDKVLERLWEKGLGVGRLFIYALKDYDYLVPYFKNCKTPNAQIFASRTFIITNCIWLSEQDFARICDVISEQAAYV